MPDDRFASAAPPAPRDSLKIYEICVVCTGNICRSPIGEVLIRAEVAEAGLADLVTVQSAGTGDWHLGERMDAGASTVLRRHGYDGAAHRARQIEPGWLTDFDLIMATDDGNRQRLLRMAAGRPELAGRIRLLRSFDPAAPAGAQVPDPYGGSAADFAEVYDLIEAAARGLVSMLPAVLGKPGD
jgi:protein-tyrosine phosphatase